MRKPKNFVILRVTLLLGMVSVCLGWLASDAYVTAAGGMGIGYVLLRFAGSNWTTRKKDREAKADRRAPARPRPAVAARPPADVHDTDALVEQMLVQGRYALLLRRQIAGTLGRGHFRRALEALQEAMALVPDGEVVLGRIDAVLDDGKLDDHEITSARGRVISVQRFFLDRFPVTNQQFYEFVAAGGYEQMALWDKSIWPAVLDLVDRTGLAGPRDWQEGCFLPDQENHPVVGVSWYEACAYARWVGKRLPTDAEWVKAGSWPVPLSATSCTQRKYPWGDTLDRKRANLWGSGPERIVPVDKFAEGVSVGGVYQLIGNVWEWTGGNFRSADHPESELLLPTPMKGIRGGAFDTYFDNQATCQFQSGENPLRRRHNVGFRCAVGVCDLVLSLSAANQAEQAPDEQAGDEQVPDEQALIAEEVRV